MTQENLDGLKKAHDYFATAVSLLTTRVQFYHEEFQGASNVVQFLSTLRDDAKAKVEQLEPKQEEPKAAFNMDLTHIKPEVVAEVN